MAATSLTLNYDAILSTTLFNYNRTLVDNISKTNALLNVIMGKEGSYQSVEDLGDRAQIPLMYVEGVADSYNGYDVLDTTPADGITSAFFNWRQFSVPITISALEEKKNSGEARIIALLEAKVKQAEIGIKEKFNRAMMQGNGINVATQITTAYTSLANGSVFIDPIPALIAYDPTTGTVGSINAANESWWRNQTKDLSSNNSYAKLLQGLDNLYNNCTKGPGGPPDLHLVDQSVYEVYVAALRNQNRFTDYRRADLPFENVAFHGQPVTWDEYVPRADAGTTVQLNTSGTWYMFNTDFVGVKYHAGTNWVNTDFKQPVNQDAKVAFILWLGCLYISNRRKCGVGGKIDTTIAS